MALQLKRLIYIVEVSGGYCNSNTSVSIHLVRTPGRCFQDVKKLCHRDCIFLFRWNIQTWFYPRLRKVASLLVPYVMNIVNEYSASVVNIFQRFMFEQQYGRVMMFL